MSKLRPLFALAVVATALAVAPGMASADTQPMTVTCSETCTASGAHWVPVDVNVIFAWPEEDTDAVATVSPECQDGAFQTISAEGDQTLHCDVTYVNGDTSSGVARVMIDKTPPVASGAATTSLQPNAAGWLSAPFQIKRVWTDSLSGVNADNCDLSPDYSGSQTDALGVETPQMECYDKAGNRAVASGLQVKFDSVGPDDVDGTPARGPDYGDWYTHPVSYVFHGTDPVPGSGLASCDNSTYSGPDSASASVTAGCVDVAGNRSNSTDSLHYDATKPTVTGATGDRAPDHNGWYTHAVAFSFQGTDATSGIDSCDSFSYSGPDSATASLAGACSDRAGNVSAFVPHTFQYDATRPTVTGISPARAADHNGWYTHPVAISFQGTDSTSGIASCDGLTYSGPDSGSAGVSGTCSDVAGNVSELDTESLRYDATKPVVSGATADRTPDHNGWYTHPVSFSFQGTDTASGIASCSTVTYSGAADAAAQLTGSCTDVAGNASSKTISFKYDATPPDKSKPYAVPGNKSVAVSWVPPADASSFVLTRALASGGPATVVYAGSAHDFVDQGLTNGTKYTYVVTTLDAAGNQSTAAAISAVADGSTLRPFIDTEVVQAPALTWAKASKAHYYNVQIYLGRKKVLSVWPKSPTLKLKSKWSFNHHTYTLKPGLYRWYVWPGIGRAASRRYGKLVGSSTFRVTG